VPDTAVLASAPCRPPTLAVAWHGLPLYGARLLRPALSDFPPRDAVVIATPGPFSNRTIEGDLRRPVTWIDARSAPSWTQLGLTPPRVFFQTGWASRAFNRLGAQVKAAGGRVVVLADNCEKPTLRQHAGALLFRLFFRRQFDAAIVPGLSGRQLMLRFGMPKDRIYDGLYGADPEIFTPGPPLRNRPHTLLFVGQLIPRKQPVLLVNVFASQSDDIPDWRLVVIGKGPLQPLLTGDRVEVRKFATPAEVARAMRESRALVLPSSEDHWPLVLHEAASSGCLLLASSGVGSRFDLIGHHNGTIFERNSPRALLHAIRWATSLTPETLDLAYEESSRIAARFGPRRFADTLQTVLLRMLQT